MTRRTLLACCAATLLCGVAAAQSTGLWSELDGDAVRRLAAAADPTYTPTKARVFRLDTDGLRGLLDEAPAEGESKARGLRGRVQLPRPSGGLETFELTAYTMLEPGLAARFPEVRTLYGRSVEDPRRTVRADWTALGFHATVSYPGGEAYVKPYARGNVADYIVYDARAYPEPASPFVCLTEDAKLDGAGDPGLHSRAGDCQIRTYRLAVAVTGEFATSTLGASSAGTAADDAIVNAHIVSSINAINAWYERDISARFVLIANQTDIYYYDGASDPYTNSSSTTMLGENIANLDAVIGSANFDLGHVLGNGGGSSGVAGLGVLCGSSKARGVTKASAFGITQPRYLKVFAHEMGHQFGAGHTQNENCQRSSTSAMEPGAGTTIMSYVTSACANQIQNVPDYYFHAISIQQMSARTLATTCAAVTANANTAPTVSAGLDHSVPPSTPLVLSAVGGDPDGDPLTYTWEQFDNEVATAIPPQPTNTQGPNFRSFPPASSPARRLPQFPDVLAGVTPTWEVLPSVARVMDFRVTVRDNSTNGIACTAEDDMRVTTIAGTPFAVTAPTGSGTTWFEGTQHQVAWDVSGTNAAPVNCANVDILLSYDGGLTFPVTLASGVPNTGTANVTVPVGTSSTARVLVSCPTNIFYNVSPADFSIQAAPSPTFVVNLTPSSATLCTGGSAAVTVQTVAVAGFAGAVSLAANNVPAGVTVNFGSSAVAAGASTQATVAVSAAASPGAYAIDIVATSGSILRTEVFNLTVEGVPAVPAPSAPAANATGVSPQPQFNWATSPSAVDYQLQVATDPGFAAVVTDVTVSGTSYVQAAALSALTDYYWRVRAANACGQSVWSAARTFTTANCFGPFVESTPVSISSSGTPTVTSTLTVTQTGTIADLRVSSVFGTHTWVGDLTVTLIAPGGSPTAVLWDGECGSADDFDLGLDDAAATPVTAAPCTPLGQGGTYQPVDALSVFDGLPVAGTWTLQIDDNANQDGGTLQSWGLVFCASSAPLPVELVDFAATPAGDHVALSWATATEVDNEGFTVERRAERESAFVPLAFLAAADDAGERGGRYASRDYDVRPGTTYYYRLRQRDRDGAETLSEVRAATLPVGEDGVVRVRPNPVRDLLTVDFPAQVSGASARLRLSDVRGRLVREASAVGGRHVLPVGGLPAGMYVLRVRHADGESVTRVVVE